MSYDKKKLAKYLDELIAGSRDQLAESEHDRLFQVISGAGTKIEMTSDSGQETTLKSVEDGSPSIFILTEGGNAQEAFIEECIKDECFANQIGARAIAGQLHKVMKLHFLTPLDRTRLEDVVKEQILKVLKSEIKLWKVRVPISNLKIGVDFSVGRTKFTPHEDGVVANTELLMAWEGPPDNPRYTIAQKAVMMGMLAEVAKQGSAWAETQIHSHQNRIVEVARNQVDLAINVIRAFTRLFAPQGIRMGFGMPHELAGRPTSYIAASDGNWAMPHDGQDRFFEFRLNEPVLKKLRSLFDFNALIAVAATELTELKSLGQAVRVAIKWLGRSVVALTAADQFTQCTIAIERLLILNGEESTTDRFAERLMYLLSDDPTQRSNIYKRAKRLYDIRSKIVHAGFEDVESDDLLGIESLAIGAFIKISPLLSAMNEHSELRDLLQRRKMGHREGEA